jgi:hypothetical protein
MMGTIMDTRTWTLPRAALTLLLSDFGLGEMPRPFEAAYPYATVAERAAFREHIHRELLAAGELDPDLEWCLTALVAAPVGIVAMGTNPSLLARGCWHQRGAVLARQDVDTIQVTALGTAPLVEAIVALVPDEKPAGGTSVTVPAETRTERRFSPYDNAASAKPFSDPVIACGAFVPFARKEFLPPVTWFDTAGQRGIGRHFTTTTVGRDGTAWTTYVPGDNERIAGSLRQLVIPLLNR